MSNPKIVDKCAELGWVGVDDMVWFSGNIRGPHSSGASQDVLSVHNDARTGEQCAGTPRLIGKHTIVSVDPLTITPSLACEVCGWHGFVTNGRWVDAGPYPIAPQYAVPHG